MEMNRSKIKVGFCVAYDWEMLRNSIPTIYEEADSICLSIDRNRQSWSGEYYDWNEEGFRRMVTELDPLHKVKIYEDQFYLPNLLPIENDARQRNKMAEFLGKGDGWHIQIDSDEYFINFKGFVEFLRSFKSKRKVNICCAMINLYKQLPEGILWIKPSSFKEIEYFPIATCYPHYESARINGYFNILTDFSILHQSWARSEEEMWGKLNNWGHSKDFDVNKYYKLWREANCKNYKSYKNFHHLRGDIWPSLELRPDVKSIGDALHLTKTDFPLPITNWKLKKANSLWISRIKKVFKSVSGN
jgi:hypothetical protein